MSEVQILFVHRVVSFQNAISASVFIEGRFISLQVLKPEQRKTKVASATTML